VLALLGAAVVVMLFDNRRHLGMRSGAFLP